MFPRVTPPTVSSLSQLVFRSDRPGESPRGEAHSDAPKLDRGRGPSGSHWVTVLAILGGIWGINAIWGKKPAQPPVTPAVTSSDTTLRSLTPDQFIAALTPETPKKEITETWEFGQFAYSGTVSPVAGPASEGETAASTVAGEQQIMLRGVLPGAERNALLQSIEERGFRVLAGPTPTLSNTPLTPAAPKDISTELLYPMARTVLTVGLVIGVLVFLGRRLKRTGAFSLPGSEQKGVVMKERPTQRFSDVGGCAEVVDELRDIVLSIKDYQSGKKDIPLVRGVLLEGEPGTGKTLLARAIAGETECAFVSFNSGDLSTEVFVGTGTRAVRQAFETARKERDAKTAELRKKDPHAEGVCIIFLDEFDSIGRKRVSAESGGDREAANIVNALLAEMDNLDQERNRGIVIVAATNKLRELDPALLRPGRFPRKINVPLPENASERVDILKKLVPTVLTSKGLVLEDESMLDRIAGITPRKSGDDMREILTIAGELARLDRRRSVTYGDLFEAYQRHFFGRVKQITVSDHARDLVAHHENGHAIVALASGIQLMIVSMKPRGGSLGRIVHIPPTDSEVLQSKKDILANILVGAGGRAAERLKFGDLQTTTGAYGDIQMVREAVKHMISSGLLGGNYAIDLAGGQGDRLNSEHIKLIDTVAAQAFQMAEEILRTLGTERVNAIVSSLRSLDRELVGSEAERFYRGILTDNERQKIRSIAQRFFEDPLGREVDKEKATR